MANKLPENHILVESELALNVYLDSLLNQAGNINQVAPDSTSKLMTGPVSRYENINQSDKEAKHAISRKIISPHLDDWSEGDVREDFATPEWARFRFSCLIFKAGGITLAVPEVAINDIIDITEDISGLPGSGRVPGVLGLYPQQGRNVQVIDMAYVVMPERSQKPSSTSHSKVRHLILVNDGKLGLAADRLTDSLIFSPQEIRWRSVRHSKPWLAGTVIEHMCIVLDTEQLSRSLESGLKNL